MRAELTGWIKAALLAFGLLAASVVSLFAFAAQY
jgi:hypothetical protein